MASGKPKRLYVRPTDHAFASGPVFQRPDSLESARAQFDDPSDGDLLAEVFAQFDAVAEAGERLRLSLQARAVSKNRDRTIRIGSDCAIRGVLRCEPGATLTIGDLVYIGDEVIVSAQSRVAIGSLTLLAHGVQIFDNDSHPVDPDEREAHFRAILGVPSSGHYTVATAPVTIGSRCWIGFSSAIMKGVTIGDGSIVASGSVVIGDVPANVVVAGNPARVVKRLRPQDEAASAPPSGDAPPAAASPASRVAMNVGARLGRAFKVLRDG